MHVLATFMQASTPLPVQGLIDPHASRRLLHALRLPDPAIERGPALTKKKKN